MGRTLFVVMPYIACDLKTALRHARKQLPLQRFAEVSLKHARMTHTYMFFARMIFGFQN